MKYEFKKIIFIPITIIIATTIIWYGFAEGLIKIEDKHIKMYKTETIRCEEPNTECDIILYNKTHVILKKGETLTLNQFNQTHLNIINYGTLLLLIIGLVINHYAYNKDYDFKQKIEEIQTKIQEK